MAKKIFRAVIGGAALAVAFVMMGCETSTLNNEGEVSLAELQGISVPVAATNATGTPPTPTPATNDPGTTGTATNAANSGFPAAIDGPIHWLHTNVSDWPATASMNASVSGGMISFPYSKSKAWPARDGVNANPWVIVKWTDGQWYAATFEWLRHGQTAKPVGVLNGSKGDHIKVSPLNRWRPHSGEKFYIMVSGLARTQTRNVKERSNVSLVTWP